MAFANVKETVEVKREAIAVEHDCCGLCGFRYEAGTKLAIMTKEVDARGRNAHPACVIRANKIVAARAAKAEAEKDMVATPRAKSAIHAVLGIFE